MERILHYVWKYRLFPATNLHTTDGLPVEFIDPGLLNTDAGPDFFNAKVKVDNVYWVGNVEIHTRSSDWFRHGHHNDKAYDSVILHLAEHIDTELYRTDGTLIPQMEFPCPESVRARYDELRKADLRPRCYAVLSSQPKLMVHSWFSALHTERLQQKTTQIMERLKRYNQHWEDVFFITLARNFGFGTNGDAFEAWASLLSLRAVDKHRDNLMQVEAIFYGQAGLLEEEEIDDTYYSALQKEYRYLRHKFNLVQLNTERWKFLRMRPGNFPHIRLAQLAMLYHNGTGLFSRCIAATDAKGVKSILTVDTSSYWRTHYSFGKTSPERIKGLGDAAKELIIINTISPFLYAYGLHKADERLCRRAIVFLEGLKAERNYITRMWDGAGLPVHSAADSQALVQLQKNYCDQRKCLHCRFGYVYLKSK